MIFDKQLLTAHIYMRTQKKNEKKNTQKTQKKKTQKKTKTNIFKNEDTYFQERKRKKKTMTQILEKLWKLSSG